MVEGTFKVEVRGEPFSRTSAISFRDRCSIDVKLIDREAVLEETLFGSIAAIYIWKGIPKHFGTSQQLLKFLDTKLGNFFTAWKLNFEMTFIEKENENDTSG